MSGMGKAINLYGKMMIKFNQTQNPIYKEVADEIVEAFTTPKEIEADPGANIFHEYRPLFSERNILEMSTDGHEVTLSTKAFVQIGEILKNTPTE